MLALYLPSLSANAYDNETYYRNDETGYEAVIEDEAGRIYSSDYSYLLEEMKPITEYGNVYYRTIIDNPYADAGTYARNYLNDQKNHYGGLSGTVFLDDTSTRTIYIFSNGYINNVISANRAEVITDNVYTYASDGDYYECAAIAYEQITTLLEGGRIAQPMKYICNTILSLSIGILLCYVFAIFNSFPSRKNYISKIDGSVSYIRLTNVNRKFVRQTKTYSPESSSSSDGGSSSGGGGGSGGGHGY